MNRRIALVVICAAALGLVASFFAYRMISQMASVPGEATEPVVVAAVNMSLADTVTSQHVKVVAWPKNSIPQGAVRSVAEAEGRVVRSSIVVGEPLLDGKLAAQLAGKGGMMPMLVPDGQRGITIKVDEAVRESGFVLPNSRVDVLVSTARPGTQERIAKVILQDVLVLAAGQAVETRENKPVTVTTVTLALTPEQTERLTLAQTEGRLALAVRNLQDNKVVATTGATMGSVLSGSVGPKAEPQPVGPPAQAKPTRAATVPLPPPRIQTATVSVIRGSRMSEHRFVQVEGGRWVERAEKAEE